MNTPTTNTEKTYTDIFAVGNVLDPHLRIEGKCRACEGSGIGFYTACCAECKKTFCEGAPGPQDFTQAQIDLARKTATSPCGHPWERWYEDSLCGECDGTGTTTNLVRLSDIITAPGPALEYIKTEEETNE